jgi:hypothetical protein
MNLLTQQLDWDVQVEEIVLPGNRKTERFALTRSDNGQLLSIRSERYHPLFNKDLEELRCRITDQTGFSFKGYQEFQKGKKILAFFENPNKNLNICGQEVKDYLVIGNSHDTTSKLFVGTSNFMVRCENQFSEKIRTFERRHDQPFNINDLAITAMLNNYEDGRRRLYQRMEYMRMKPAEKNTIRHLIDQLFGSLENTNCHDRKFQKNREQSKLLLQCIQREISDLGMNYWALLNGVTRYTSNHLNGNPGFGIVNGKGEKLNRKALNFLERTL